MGFVIIPGIDGSDAEHWQSLWEAGWGAEAVRIAPASWTEPSWGDWQEAISSAVTEVGTTGSDGVAQEQPVLVAHSLGCLAAAAWLQAHPGAAVGFLVAVPDPAGPRFPSAAADFGVVSGALGSAAVVVASADDPYGSVAFSREVAVQWGATWVEAGALAHISSGSALGVWPQGRELLGQFLDGARPTSSTPDGRSAGH